MLGVAQDRAPRSGTSSRLTLPPSSRYYKPWKDAQNSLVDVKADEDSNGKAWGLTYEGYKPRASGDKTLTAFAQLATLRLNVRRAMVSLIDSTQRKCQQFQSDKSQHCITLLLFLCEHFFGTPL